MWLWAGEPTDLIAVYLVRLSICLFFLRLVPPKRIYIWTIWITILLLTVSNIFTSIYFFFECRPIRKVWSPMTEGMCFNNEVKKGAIWLYQGRWSMNQAQKLARGEMVAKNYCAGTSIYGDLVLLIIPTKLFWRLQVPLRIKIGLIIICSLGVLYVPSIFPRYVYSLTSGLVPTLARSPKLCSCLSSSAMIQTSHGMSATLSFGHRMSPLPIPPPFPFQSLFFCPISNNP